MHLIEIPDDAYFLGDYPTTSRDDQGNQYYARVDRYEVGGIYWGEWSEPPSMFEDIIELIPIRPIYKCWGKGVKK